MYYSGAQVKEHEKGTVCGTYRERQKSIQGFVGKSAKDSILNI
jgi:hypothetical protein